MNTAPRRQLRGLPQGLCPFPCAAPPRRRASCRLCPRCRLCPLCLSLRHLCGCLSAADDDNTHAALPKHTVPDAGQARYYDSSRRHRGRSAVHGGRVVVVLSPSLSPSVGGGGTLSRRLCRRAVCRRQPFPPHSLGCRSVLCGQSGSAPSLHPRGARGGMCGEQPTCRLALGGTHGTAGSERALSVGAHFVCLHRRCSARGGTTAWPGKPAASVICLPVPLSLLASLALPLPVLSPVVSPAGDVHDRPRGPRASTCACFIHGRHSHRTAVLGVLLAGACTSMNMHIPRGTSLT